MYLPGVQRGRIRAALAAAAVVGLLPARKACQQPREGLHTLEFGRDPHVLEFVSRRCMMSYSSRGTTPPFPFLDPSQISLRGCMDEVPRLVCVLQHAPPCFVYAAVFQPAEVMDRTRGASTCEMRKKRESFEYEYAFLSGFLTALHTGQRANGRWGEEGGRKLDMTGMAATTTRRQNFPRGWRKCRVCSAAVDQILTGNPIANELSHLLCLEAILLLPAPA